MNQEKINKEILEQLEDHEKRIRDLEDLEAKSSQVGKTKKKRSKSSKESEDLTVPIKKLVDSGFFKEAKIDLDVLSELQKRLLTNRKPLRPSVVNVLRKMVKKEILERVDIVRGKKNLIAYKNKS